MKTVEEIEEELILKMTQNYPKSFLGKEDIFQKFCKVK